MTAAPFPITVSALYHFTRIDDLAPLREALLALMQDQGIKGTLLLAHEGINGTVAGSADAIAALHEYLRADPRFAGLETKESPAKEMPFRRSKVKLKKEIVTMGVADIDPLEDVGAYVAPQDWNALISDPDTLVVDTRNDYEIAIGSFEGAIDPRTKNFREFPAYVEEELSPHKDKPIAMFCTGGIRCEKATAYLKRQGFEKVYHLKGGILKYLEDVPQENSLWQGDCFVFDERVAVTHGLKQGHYGMCHACRYPLSEEELADPAYVEGVSCPHCIGETTADQRARFAERQKQVELAEARGEEHIGENCQGKKAAE